MLNGMISNFHIRTTQKKQLDAWYHIMNRGRRGEPVFYDREDYSGFIELPKEAVEMWEDKDSRLLPDAQLDINKYSSIERRKNHIWKKNKMKKV
ncbi:hypothetical protein ACFL0H_13810 [Thermodesulfobacteriota bacterium]